MGVHRDGRPPGGRATIPVPSQWEQHGFGTYDYGQDPKKSDEHGLYRLRFSAPKDLEGKRVRLVFEGVMTDATVKLNGRLLGPTHQGAFYRFAYDVNPDLKLDRGARNVLEVDVGKASANPDTNKAERDADYWVFGGIFRPVWLEAAPKESIEHVAIDARADGSLTAQLTLAASRTADAVKAEVLDAGGRAFGAPFSARIAPGGGGKLRLATRLTSPRLWTAETPNLYRLRLTLMKGHVPLHSTTQRFGFRTFEVRPGKGLYLNGKRILLKGVNRHAFRPKSGRALDPKDSWDDVRLVRAMNMNAIRMAHYPPDEALLEAADELGLYVLNELSGWQHAHDTDVGRRLVRALVERDVNHPSILFWNNGNEGGWNRALDGEFALYDPQRRPVLHPWELHGGIDTVHYSDYADLTRRLRGPHLVMPTEVLHGLYDGGAGAGLDDYWQAISGSAFGGGIFLWSFTDEGIVRTDEGGRIDVFSTYAPDGVIGPNQEKEGSFYTVREIFSPVQVAAPVLDSRFAGALRVSNHYDFTSLAKVRFEWRLLRFPGPLDRRTDPTILARGKAASPPVPPGGRGELKLGLPGNWRGADALALVASGTEGQALWTWVWPTPALADRLAPRTGARSRAVPAVQTGSGEVRLVAGKATVRFDSATGLLRCFGRCDASTALTNGPRLAFVRPALTEPRWTDLPRDPADTASAGCPPLSWPAASRWTSIIRSSTPGPASSSKSLPTAAIGRRSSIPRAGKATANATSSRRNPWPRSACRSCAVRTDRPSR